MEIIVPINAKEDINIMDAIKKVRNRKKLEYLKAEVRRKFDGVVHNCCKVSANNHKIAFVIYRSVLGYPMLEQIDWRDNVVLSDKDNCVIVKDGYVYELTKRVE